MRPKQLIGFVQIALSKRKSPTCKSLRNLAAIVFTNAVAVMVMLLFNAALVPQSHKATINTLGFLTGVFLGCYSFRRLLLRRRLAALLLVCVMLGRGVEKVFHRLVEAVFIRVF